MTNFFQKSKKDLISIIAGASLFLNVACMQNKNISQIYELPIQQEIDIEENKILYDVINQTLGEFKEYDLIKEIDFYNDRILWGYVDGDSTLQNFTLGLNKYSALKKDKTPTNNFIYTLIHEQGHLISLNSNQVTPYYDADICPTLELPEGCLKQNSYLYDFYKEFWQDEHAQKNYLENNTNSLKFNIFHFKNRKNFLNANASTNITEDFAESFTHYVLDISVNEKHKSYQKITFFDKYDDLKDMKERIQQNLSKFIEK
ncbi:MAG: hypothetical protein ACLFN8_00870 [Candidatus Woesearchaeota archaeon]